MTNLLRAILTSLSDVTFFVYIDLGNINVIYLQAVLSRNTEICKCSSDPPVTDNPIYTIAEAALIGLANLINTSIYFILMLALYERI